MRKKLLTKHCALMLLAIFATAWSTTAWAGIRIYVRTEGSAAGTAPNLYVWNEAREPINGSWPGTQMSRTTTTSDGTTWYYEDFTATNIGAIINNSSGQTTDLTGINEDRYYSYKGGSEYYNLTNQYVIPENATYIEGKKFVYFVNTSEWQSPHAHVYNNNGNITGDWPGETMTKVENSVNLWKWESETSETQLKIIFNDGGGQQSQTFNFTNGGYYNAANLITTITEIFLNNTNFPDDNFRTALAELLGANEGDVIYPNNVKVLDVSGKGISNLEGIANFTNLEELYAGDNDLSHLLLTNNSKLQILDIKNNNQIIGFSSTTATATNHYINLSPSSNKAPLIKFDASGCPHFGYFRAIHDSYGISSLEWLSLNGCTAMNGWSNGIAAQTGLKYLDLTNTGQNVNHSTQSSRISVTGLTNLETLILADNANLCSSAALDLTHNTKLKYLDLSNTGLNETRAKTTLNTDALSNLETLKINKNPNMASAYTGTLSSLKHFEIADGDLYFTQTHQLSSLTPSNNPNLEYLDISNDQIYSSANPIDGFQNLKTVVASDNPNMPKLTINNCPAIEAVDVSNNTGQTILSITNSALTAIPEIDFTNTPLLTKLDLSNNNFTAVPEVASATVTTMVMNSNMLSNLSVPSNIKYLYAEDNNFGSGEFELLATSLVGLDLANNGFTKFKMTGNTTLKALTLAVDNSRNSTLTEIELHGNTKLTQTSPNGNIEISDCDEEDETDQDRFNKGLYIKGLSNLQTLNIENSYFEKMGQENSLEGLTGLTKLQARKNKFTTFTNGVYPIVAAGKNYRPADPTESSLEHLTNLTYLDLAYNNLRDSVHLYKNTELTYLDVSHNRTIHGVYDRAITSDNIAAQKAMRAKKAFNLMKYGKVYNGVGVNPTVGADWVDGLPPEQAATARPFDIRYEDLNDTIGLYHLNLCMNTKLEYLDISYTNIHNTAAGPEYMNPGWMDKDWVTDMGTWEAESADNTTTKRVYSSWHTFVYFIPCSQLREFHTDHNNMRSLGVKYFPHLEILTSSYMYGDGDYMRDFGDYGNGNIGLSSQVQELKSVTWSTNSNGDPVATITLKGPNGPNSYYPNPTKYYDVSHSGFNEIRVNAGVNLEYLDVSGNPLNFALHDQTKSYNNSLDVTYCPNIVTVKADNCSDLPIVRAYNRPELVQLNVDNDPKLKALYIQKDPKLSLVSADAEDERACFTGLSTLEGLETLFAYTNPQFRGIDVTNNTALKNLWISNIRAGSIDLSNNTALTKLRIYDNSLAKLDLENNTALTWLDLARNQVPSLDLSTNGALQYFNCSNSVESLTDPSLDDDSHDGSEADEEVPVSGTAKADNGGNSLSDLVFAAAAPLTDVRANYNDLHKISGGFAGLTNIEYAHNHINGIDLSAANLENLNVNSEDNGREIVADCATFKKNVNGTVQEYKVYFFQLMNVDGNGAQLTTKTSTDSKGTSRVIGSDGLVLDNIKAWTENAAVLESNTTNVHLNSTVTTDNMNLLDPEDVPGKIVVLNPSQEDSQGAKGEAKYSYNDGFESTSNHASTYYLKWSSNGIITGINMIDPDQDVNIENTYGNLIVSGIDGTVVGVYDMNGRLVANEIIAGGKATITGLTPGIYIVNGNKVLIK